MSEIQMASDDYVLWLKGMFDAIGDRTPTPEEWHRFREQNIMQVGDVVLRRVEEREIAHKEKMRQAEIEAEKMAQYKRLQDLQALYGAGQIGQTSVIKDLYTGATSTQLAASAMSAVNLSAKVPK